jgi:hypothetical protein
MAHDFPMSLRLIQGFHTSRGSTVPAAEKSVAPTPRNVELPSPTRRPAATAGALPATQNQADAAARAPAAVRAPSAAAALSRA